MAFIDVMKKVNEFGQYMKDQMGFPHPTDESPSPEESPDPHTRGSRGGLRELNEAMKETPGGDTRKYKNRY